MDEEGEVGWNGADLTVFGSIRSEPTRDICTRSVPLEFSRVGKVGGTEEGEETVSDDVADDVSATTEEGEGRAGEGRGEEVEDDECAFSEAKATEREEREEREATEEE